jgi:TPR repeat protein
MHRGDSLPFWEQACADSRPHACERLLMIETNYCIDNAGWACNEVGRHYVEGRIVAPDLDQALLHFSRACEARFQAGCVNLLDPQAPARADPRPLDQRLLVREGGPNLLDAPESELYSRACRHGWSFACSRLSASR